MKKLLCICALAAFLGATVVGCGGSPTSEPPKPTPKKEEKMTDGKADTKAKP